MKNSQYIPFISNVLSQASEIAVQNFQNISQITVKSDDNNQVLTETDIAIGKMIVSKIQSSFPDHNIIDEEAGVIDSASKFTWVVDPIDGTSNFAAGLPTYGCMVGLLHDSTAIAGGIVLPAFKELYVAEKNHGAFCNDTRVTVSQDTELLNSLVAYGIDGHQENPEYTRKEASILGEIILSIRNLRTTNSAYDMAQTVSGKYGLFLNRTTKIWDNVALQPLIEEAGGIVTDFWGEPMNYSNPLQRSQENFTICAGAPALHKEIQTVIHSSKK